MKPVHKLSVPKPCHENWDAMTSIEKGKFCDRCATTVIDFTAMSAQEIKAYLGANMGKKICGRFNTETLDSVHLSISSHIIKNTRTFRKAFLLALLITMGTTLVNCTDSNGNQKKIDSIQVEQIDTITSEKLSSKDKTIKNQDSLAQSKEDTTAIDHLDSVVPKKLKRHITMGAPVAPKPPEITPEPSYNTLGEPAYDPIEEDNHDSEIKNNTNTKLQLVLYGME